jgi:hypothetical protein
MYHAPAELYVVTFPCGAFRAVRTMLGAQRIAQETIKDGTCCPRGHTGYVIEKWLPNATLDRAHGRAKLRVVK